MKHRHAIEGFTRFQGEADHIKSLAPFPSPSPSNIQAVVRHSILLTRTTHTLISYITESPRTDARPTASIIMSDVQPIITPGRLLIVAANLAYSIGAFVADWSETHVLNPRWPPHARFHNGQTMTLGTLLASTSIYFALRPIFASTSSLGEEKPGPSTRSTTAAATASSISSAREDVFHAALIGCFYCLAGMSAILYPGTAWSDPEFQHGGEQRYIFSTIIALVWAGYWLERRRLVGLESRKGKAQ